MTKFTFQKFLSNGYRTNWDEKPANPREVNRMLRLDELEKRERNYTTITRGWWWRGIVVGLGFGFAAGAVVIYLVARLTGSLA